VIGHATSTCFLAGLLSLHISEMGLAVNPDTYYRQPLVLIGVEVDRVRGDEQSLSPGAQLIS
jgi:hypothetical protein